jgi:hypothetical protein
MIILDTDVISAAMQAEPRVVDWLNRQPASSVWTTTLTIFEIRYGLAVMPMGARRRDRERAFDEVIEQDLSNRVLVFDLHAAEEAGQLLAERRRSGRMVEIRDTMIAAIALAQNATLATRNIKHFADLRIPVVNPFQA